MKTSATDPAHHAKDSIRKWPTYFRFTHARDDEGDDGGDRYAETLYTERDAPQNDVILREARAIRATIETALCAWPALEAAVVAVGNVQLSREVAALDLKTAEEAVVRVGGWRHVEAG